MNITDLLTQEIEVGSQFSAGIVHIDIIDSSSLKGTDQEVSSTKDALKALIESLFEGYPIAVFDWRGDGGLLLFHDTKGLDDLVIICDKLINLLQFFNQSRGLCNFLYNDEVHLRIVCHAGFIKNTGSAETLHHEAINYLVKREREVGVFDHVVVTEDVKKRLSDSLKDRLFPAKEADEKLGLTYILDWRRAATTIQLNEETSEAMLLWIEKSLEQNRFDQLLLFSYSNETLAKYIVRLTDVKIRILARNWLVEADEEKAYYDLLKRNSNVEANSKPILPLRMKSGIISSWAKMLVGPEAPHLYQKNIDIRFYDSPPWFKGAILRNSGGGRREAFVGFYKWDPGRKEGGSPWVGRHWPATWLSDDNGPQSIMLDVLESRFAELWDGGYDFSSLKKMESDKEEKLALQSKVKMIWGLDEMPYMIVIPGRTDPERLYAIVATEDLNAMVKVQGFLKDRGAEVDFRIKIEQEYSDTIKNWPGHLVFICHRTLEDDLIAGLYNEGCPYSINREGEENLTLTHKVYKQTFCSPMDSDPPSMRDYSLVIKCDRPGAEGKLFAFAGIHAMGTLGGTIYLTSPDHLRLLCDKVEEKNFAALVQCEFDGPWLVRKVKDVMAPESF